MMGKWARFDFCGDSSLIRGEGGGGGGLISHFILSKIVGVLCGRRKQNFFIDLAFLVRQCFSVDGETI